MIISLDDHMRLLVEEFLPVVDKYVYSVLIETRPRHFSQIGSCVCVKERGHCYIATAEHVISNILDSGNAVYIGTGNLDKTGTIFKLPASEKFWMFHPDEEADLALLELPEPIAGVCFFPLSPSTTSYIPSMRGRYFLAGYTNSQNKEFKVNTDAQTKSTYIQPVIVKVDPDLDFEKNGKDRKLHIGFEYNRVTVGGKGNQQGVSLKGMSGAGLWYISDEVDTSSILLAGILIEWHKDTHVAYATLAKYLDDLIP
jgi:hypothetical protein